jgi:hypothetical protein
LTLVHENALLPEELAQVQQGLPERGTDPILQTSGEDAIETQKEADRGQSEEEQSQA